MPKVGKHFYRYNTTIALEVDIEFGTPEKYRIKQKDKYFWIRLPNEIAEFNDGLDYCTGKTQDEATNSFDEIIKNFYDAKQEKKKVIGYKFEHEIGEQDGYNKGVFHEHEMKLEFVIGTITTIGGKKFFSTEKDSKLYPIGQNRWNEYDKFTFINHSKEAEEWFVKTWTALKEMIKACKKFFSQPEGKLLQAMLSSNLLTYKEKK